MTARYWVLKMLITSYSQRPFRIFDSLSTDSDVRSGSFVRPLSLFALFASPRWGFIRSQVVYVQGSQDAAGVRRILLLNKTSATQTVNLVGVTPMSTMTYCDPTTGFNPPPRVTLPASNSLFKLQPFGVYIIQLA